MSKAKNLRERFSENISQAISMRPGKAAAPAAQAATDRYADATRARSFAELPVDALVCDLQPRSEFDPDELARLAESIKQFGQLAPIRCRYDEARAQWVVLVGERRLRACRLAGLEKIRVELVERAMTEADILTEQIVENAVRSDLQPVEQGRAYKRLMDLNGWTAQELAQTIGLEPTSVYRSLALLRLPDDVAAQVDAGQIKASSAYEIAKLSVTADQRALALEVLQDRLDHALTVEAARQRRAGGTRAKPKVVRSRIFRTDKGKVIVQLRRPSDNAAIRAILREVLRQLDGELSGESAA